jgi:hypothetical protein
MNRATYQQVKDADEIDDNIVVRIWRVDGKVVAEADHPTIEHAPTGQLIVATLGNPTTVENALVNAHRMRDTMPFDTIYVELADDVEWNPKWGDLLPIKSSSLQAKPFR